MISFPTEWPYFFNATILDWKPLLQEDKTKQIIVDSLQFLVKEKRIKLTAFVIMNTHIHIVWQPLAGYTKEKIQLQFMKYTAQQLKFYLQANDIKFLEEFYVNKKDRQYPRLIGRAGILEAQFIINRIIYRSCIFSKD